MVRYLFATEEQTQLAEGARKILEKELVPILAECEATETFPMHVLKTLAAAGYYCPDIPAEWGGLGLDITTRCLIAEEMAKVDGGFSFAFNTTTWHYIPHTSLSKEEIQVWMDRHIAGEVVGTMALTEPDAGSDALAMRMTAVKDGDEWVLNGTKCFISQSPIADYVCVVAYTDKSLSSRGTTMFFVEKERGFKIGKQENKMGMRLSPTAEVIFEDVRVPDDHIVGKVGEGFKWAMSMITEARVCSMGEALGIAQAAMDYAVKYAKERRTFGKRIIEHQGLGFLLADMQVRLDANRALLYYAATALDRGIDIGTLGSVVKIFSSDTAMSVTTDAVQVLGGYGYMKDYPVEKLMRDAKLFAIFEGTNQINLQTIYKAIAGKDPQAAGK